MFGSQEQGSECPVRVTNHHDSAEMERADECCQILRINYSRITGALRIRVRIVVAPAVRNRPIAFGERANLIRPVSAIAQRTVDENDRCSFPLVDIVPRDASANLDCPNR